MGRKEWLLDTTAVLPAEAGKTAEISPPPVPSDRSLVQSILWNAGSDWATQILTWLSFLEVIRLLSPGDFGIAALAGILMPYMGQLTGLGFPRAVVALRNLSEEQLAQMNTLSLMSATGLFFLGVAIAKPFAAFFKTPALAPVFIVACSGLMMSALVAVPAATIVRDLRFRFASLLGAACALIAAAATLGLALMGCKYWALLLGNMIAGVFRAIVILRERPCRLAWPRLRTIREPLRFGWQISISVLAMNSYQRLDNFVAGRVLGAAALGFYGNAWELANLPIEKVASLVTTVIPSYLSAVQDQPAALRRYLRGLTELIALATFPATIGLSLVAPEAVPVILGHKWDEMVRPLQILSFYAGFRSIMALLPKVLTSIGQVRFVMWNDLAALVLLPIGFYIGSFRGTPGIAWAWVVVYPFIVLPLYRKTFQAIDMKVGEYFRALRPAIIATLVMIVAVIWVRYRIQPMHSTLARLCLEVGAGVATYAAALWLVHRDRLFQLFGQAKGLVTRQTLPTT